MAYFPKAMMPDIRKRDLSESPAGAIHAEDFNAHVEAILSIERLLGVTDASESDLLAISQVTTDPRNLMGCINYMYESMNLFTDEGVASTAGYLNSGQRIIFPENAMTAFLSAIPAKSDRTIKVSSTFGFPDNGVLSILNDIDSGAGVTPVEWIKYTGRTATAFMNCERGYLGTTIGTHIGSPAPDQLQGELNSSDYCVALPINQRICNRRYQGWKTKNIFNFAAFGISGTIVDLTRAIKRGPDGFLMTRAALGGQYDRIITTASQLQLLGTRANGDAILRSSNTDALAADELTWTEAFNFVSILKVRSVITLLRGPAEWVVGKTPFIPVFQGMMSISYSLAGGTINSSARTGFPGVSTGSPDTSQIPGPTVTDGNVISLDVQADEIDIKYARITPIAVATRASADGDLYVIDTAEGTRIRHVNLSTDEITTVAGRRHLTGYSGDGGAAILASINATCLCVDDAGNIYFGDANNHVVRKVTAGTGIISTIAGNGTSAYTVTAGAVATSVSFRTPTAIDVDGNGNVWFTDIDSDVMLVVTTQGKIFEALASTDVGYGLALSTDGLVYYSNVNRVFRASITSVGSSGVTLGTPAVFAGAAGTGGALGNGGAATSAQLGTLTTSPIYLAAGSPGVVLINDADNGQVRSVLADGKIYKASDTTATSLRSIAMLEKVYFIGSAHLQEFTLSQTLAAATTPLDGTQPIPSIIVGDVDGGSETGTTEAPNGLTSVNMKQTADGRIIVASTTDIDARRMDQAVVQYHTFFVGSSRSLKQRNTV